RSGLVTDGEKIIDEALAVIMLPPRSYTTEESAEIYSHGGMAATRGVLGAALKNGARPAMPGEFTKRAFINGRLDLSQAEAVMQLIGAKTELGVAAGVRQLRGGLSRRVFYLRETTIGLIANVELSIDYPEHESEAMNLREIRAACERLSDETARLAKTFETGRIIAEGARVTIVGSPNAGKSSLLNAVLREDRAIVAETPGTTRDVLTEPVGVRGLPLYISDTAGVRETDEAVEKIGVEKTMESLACAELAIWVVDRSRPPSREDFMAAGLLRDKNFVAVLSKCDLPCAGEMTLERFEEAFAKYFEKGISFIEVSAVSMAGLERMYDAVEAALIGRGEFNSAETEIVANERHRYLLDSAAREFLRAIEAIDAGATEDLVAVHLGEAYRRLGEITGDEIGEDIIDRIFSEFCVGK
ncbi:MAG: tRNA uridine-5-carboxymethylaminomethyl(34) synthesis GTPase MnmE, partial [Defluviitaleaceae bacterium]|nr:tRNA uridine-5-carboxymethylaminomethyl(34) synthesis GTPase MnmE [Defluviitaleaceae bacterium]